MSGQGDQLIEKIVTFHQEDNELGIVNVFRDCVFTTDKSCRSDSLRKLHLVTWPLPMEKNLIEFAQFVISKKVFTIYSIGCGSGLLEWLMLKFITVERDKQKMSKNDNVKLIGVEVDSNWWNSIYSPPKFIPLQFYPETFQIENKFGQSNDMTIFCYFNNLKMFSEYLASFRGKFVVLIGPISSEQFCSPGPKELAENFNELPTNEWDLIKCEQFGFISIDHLAIYKRAEQVIRVENV